MTDGARLKALVESQKNKTKQQIADGLKMTRSNLYQLYDTKHFEEETIKKIEKYFGIKWAERTDTVQNNTVQKPKTADVTDINQPMVQVILNLSYEGKKNADNIGRMAATNQRNSDLIAALFCELFPNSKFADKLASSLTSQSSDDDDFAIEDELSREGIDLLKDQMQAGKQPVKGK